MEIKGSMDLVHTLRNDMGDGICVAEGIPIYILKF